MSGQLFFFREDGILKKINLDEIVVMEATGNYVKLYAAAYTCLIRITMDALLRQLPKDLFVRIHRSVVVAADHVDSIGRDYVTLTGVPDHMFPLSKIFYAQLLEKVKIIETKKEK